jgi:hypothetical protein
MRLCLGLRLETGPGRDSCELSAEFAAEFLQQIEGSERESPIPLFWNFPVAPVMDRQSRWSRQVIGLIKGRIQKGRDQLIPCGFSGAPHPLLLPEELEYDLRWCHRNPWFPAVRTLADAPPTTILPGVPDLRPDVVNRVYEGQGFTSIGIAVPLYRVSSSAGGRRGSIKPLASPHYTIGGSDSQVGLRPIALLRPEELSAEKIAALWSACGKADTLHLLISLPGDDPGNRPADAPADGRATAERLLGLLARQRRIEFHPFAAEARGSTPIDPAELLKFIEPVNRSVDRGIWDRIEKMRRKKRKSGLQMRDLLQTVAEAAAPPRTGPGPRDRSGAAEPMEIANISMAGSVTLIGIGLQATFSRGRLSNLVDHGRSVLPGEPGRSFLTVSNRREVLQTESAFSFDREGQTGLRSIFASRLGKDTPQVKIFVDYYFADERDCLTLEISALYPALSAGFIGECAPLELCLCSFTENERPQIEVQTPGRDGYRVTVAAGSRIFAMTGKIFGVRNGLGTVELEASPRQMTRSEQLEFRVEKRRSAFLLWANLGGSYLPQRAADLSDRRLQLSYNIRFSAGPSEAKCSSPP